MHRTLLGAQHGCQGFQDTHNAWIIAYPTIERERVEQQGSLKGAGLLDEETARYSRGYVQHWLGGNEFPEASARKVLKGADAILRAGREAAS